MKEDDCFCDVILKVSKQRALTLEVTGFCRGVIEASRSSGLLRWCMLGTANLRHLNISEERNPERRKCYCFYNTPKCSNRKAFMASSVTSVLVPDSVQLVFHKYTVRGIKLYFEPIKVMVNGCMSDVLIWPIHR